jgi:enamine deaminase RidA (YjgF/YER057c/UK114 family)
VVDKDIGFWDRHPFNAGVPIRKKDDMIFIGQQLPIDENNNIVGSGDVKKQAEFALSQFKGRVEAAGASMKDVIEVQSFHADARTIEPVLKIAKKFFPDSKPAWAAISSTGLARRECQVCFSGLGMVNAKIKDINPGLEWYNSPPWDVAVPCKVANDLMIFGQFVGRDEKGKIVAAGDPLQQSRFALGKMVECLNTAGGKTDNITDMVIYVKDHRGADDFGFAATQDFLVKDWIAGPRFGERYAGTSIVMKDCFHEDILIQFHAYGVLGDKRKIPLGKGVPYTFNYPGDIIMPAVKCGRYLFIAGQVCRDPGDTIVDPSGEGTSVNIKQQARYALWEMEKLLSFLGADMTSVVSITAYHKDTRDIKEVLEVAHEFWPNEKPAWTSVGCTGLYLRAMTIEIYGLAIIDDDIIEPWGKGLGYTG